MVAESSSATPSKRLQWRAATLVEEALGIGWSAHLDEDAGSMILREKKAGSDTGRFKLLWWGEAHPSPTGRTLWLLRRPTKELYATLRAKDQNFVDIARRVVRIRIPGLMIDRTLTRETAGVRLGTSGRSPFSDRASYVTRTLMAQSSRPWSLTALATAAEVELGLASRVVSHLAEEGLVETYREGRSLEVRLTSPWALFRRWVTAYRWSANVHLVVAAPIGDLDRGLARVVKAIEHEVPSGRAALTGPAGAALTAPHASWDNVHLYVDLRGKEELHALAKRVEWAPSREGRVVLMAPRYKSSVWWKTDIERGIRVVHPLQLMLDLWHYPVRGMEMAEYIARRLRWPAPE